MIILIILINFQETLDNQTKLNFNYQIFLNQKRKKKKILFAGLIPMVNVYEVANYNEEPYNVLNLMVEMSQNDLKSTHFLVINA